MLTKRPVWAGSSPRPWRQVRDGGSESLNESIQRDYSAGFQACIEYSVKEIDLGKSLFPDSGSVLFKVDCLHKGFKILEGKYCTRSLESKI